MENASGHNYDSELCWNNPSQNAVLQLIGIRSINFINLEAILADLRSRGHSVSWVFGLEDLRSRGPSVSRTFGLAGGNPINVAHFVKS